MTRPGFEPGPPRWEAGDYFFYYLVCEAIGTAATPGLLCQPRAIVKMIVEKQMEWTLRLARETEVLRENLPQRHFCPSQNPTWSDPGLNPGRRDGKSATNRLSYGAAYLLGFLYSSWYESDTFLRMLVDSRRVTRPCITENKIRYMKRLQNFCIRFSYKFLHEPLDVEYSNYVNGKWIIWGNWNR
jgi:hypothetical protein